MMQNVLAYGPNTAPSSGKLNLFHIGNSISSGRGQPEAINSIGTQAGHSMDGSYSHVYGGTLEGIYKNPQISGVAGYAGIQRWDQALVPSKKWDGLILQYTFVKDYKKDAKYAVKFLDLALAGNPNVQLYLFNVWPNSNMVSNPPYERTYAYALELAKEIDRLRPNAKKTIIIPAGEVIVELGKLAEKGKIPGVTALTDFFEPKDPTHMNYLGSWVVALTHLSVIFKENPVNYSSVPLSPFYHPLGWYKLKDPLYKKAIATAPQAKIKQVVWEVVNSRERTGLSSSAGRDSPKDKAKDNDDSSTAKAIRVQAEKGSLSGTNYVASWVRGHEGSGHVSRFDKAGDALTVSFTDVKAGSYDINIRYHSWDSRSNLVVINDGNPRPVLFKRPTDVWNTTSLSNVTLSEGVNTVKIEAVKGLINVDWIEIVPSS